MRLCANTGACLHLIEPLGFRLEDRELRRAGLDYREWAEVRTHASLDAFLESVQPSRLLAFTTRAARLYTEMEYQENDALLFGPETRGLPQALLDSLPENHKLRLPLQPGNRSLNLSNTVAVAVYEAWRQQGFSGGK
jgi:tRNA (cytidine/uridine-2'-O-)-methyltransferase